ncbi:MAG: helix-turn-helix transcriptional regulator [Acetobacteraceae bacterium]|nr:helix-turn-helix transcriptional regulator [Acetobacteraceae bacterium]
MAAPESSRFAERLRLALGRANLSRALVAQRLGLDKSVVTRWASGAMRPSDHNLTALSALIGERVPGFSRAAFEGPEDAFAALVGLPAAMPDRPDAHRPGSLGMFLAEAREWTEPHLDDLEDRFAGLWVNFYANLHLGNGIGAAIGEIWRGPDGLEARFRNGASGPGRLGRSGPIFATGTHFFMANSAPRRNRTFGAVLCVGTERRTALMDGIIMHPMGSRADQPFAGRMLLLRLGPPEPDWAKGDRRFWAAGTYVEQLNEEGWHERLPAALAAAFQSPSSPMGTLIHPDTTPFLMAEYEIGVRNLPPERAALRDAVLAVRAAFAPALDGLVGA